MNKSLTRVCLIATVVITPAMCSREVKAQMLPSTAFVSSSSFCRDIEYSALVWIKSDHGKRRDGQQELNEKNHGLSLNITCDGWLYAHAGKLKNSQWGYTDLVMVGITNKWYPFEENKFHLQASLGEVYLRYRVPRLGADAEGHALAGYLGIGYGPLTLQVAPVPKQKGVYIAFVQAKILF